MLSIMTEEYSLSTDFTSGLDSSKLEKQIRSSAITVNLLGISSCDDVVQIEFESALEIDDKSLLNAMCAAHVPDALHRHEYIRLTIQGSTDLDFYETIGTFTINDKSHTLIDSISIMSRLDGSVTSYDVRVFDVTHNNILATANFNNASFQLNDMGTISNIPEEESLLEVQIKKNGGDGRVHLSEITIYLI